MSENQNGHPQIWSELEISGLVLSEKVQKLHALIEKEWSPLQRTACQTAAGRALWKHVTNDSLAELLAGEKNLKSFYDKIKKDCLNCATEISGVILAVRTLWFDSKLQTAVRFFDNVEALQVVLLGAGMDTRAYRLNFLSDCHVFEVDFPQVIQMKASLLQEANTFNNTQHKAKSMTRVEVDISNNNDWFEKLQISGFDPKTNTIWILEGILYYLSDSKAIKVLKTISSHCSLTPSILLADFINKPSTKLSNSDEFQFYSDWPDRLLPSLGFSDVKLSQIGDQDAHFGLLNNPENMFDKLRSVPRSVEVDPNNGRPCCRLYLVQASVCPSTSNLYICP